MITVPYIYTKNNCSVIDPVILHFMLYIKYNHFNDEVTDQ